MENFLPHHEASWDEIENMLQTAFTNSLGRGLTSANLNYLKNILSRMSFLRIVLSILFSKVKIILHNFNDVHTL